MRRKYKEIRLILPRHTTKAKVVNKVVNKEVTIATTTHRKHFASHITHTQHKDQVLNS
jgi:hypothetical protein